MKASFEVRRTPAKGLSYTCYLRKERQLAFNWHYHPEFELTYIIKGRGVRLVGDHAADFKAGDLVLLGSNLPHTWSSEGASSEDSEAVVIQFAPGYFPEPLLELAEWAHVRRVLAESALGLRYSGDVVPRVARRMKALLKVRGLAGFAGLAEILEILAGARTRRSLATPAFAPGLKTHQQARLQRILEHIGSRWTEELSLGDIATFTHMSPSSFSRFFRRMTKKSYIKYLTELRVGHACRMLAEEESGVAEIAFACGFGNLSNFNRRFREIMGTQPREYRRSLQSRAED